MSEKYTIDLLRRTHGGVEEVLRSHTADSLLDAEILVESIRESYEQRDSVVWDGDVVDSLGHLYGLSGGQVYTIQVAPPLGVSA